MGSALAFPARENGHTVRLTGTPLDKDIIDHASKTGQHPKFDRPFPDGVEYYHFEEISQALKNCDLIICGVSSFGVDWFAHSGRRRLAAVHPLRLQQRQFLPQFQPYAVLLHPRCGHYERRIKKEKIHKTVYLLFLRCNECRAADYLSSTARPALT